LINWKQEKGKKEGCHNTLHTVPFDQLCLSLLMQYQIQIFQHGDS